MSADIKLIDFIRTQQAALQSEDAIRVSLAQASWQPQDVDDAFMAIEKGKHQKWVNSFSFLFFCLVLFGFPAAFSVPIVMTTLNSALVKIPGALNYEIITAIPVIIPLAIINSITFMLIAYAAFRVRAGSHAAWKTASLIICAVLILGVCSTIMLYLFINPTVLRLGTPR